MLKGFVEVSVLAFAVFVAVAYAKCSYVDVPVSSSDDFSKACEKAQPGWNIILKKGTYSNSANWFKFSSSGTSDCPITITCKKPGEAVFASTLSLYRASYVNVANVSFSTSKGQGIVATELNSVTIENVRFSGCSQEGVWLYSAKDVTVRDCTFDTIGDYAVKLDGAQNSVVKGCTFGDKLAYNELTHAVIWLLHNSNSNVLTENVFYGRAGGFDHWIDFDLDCGLCQNNEFSLNVFENSDGRVMRNGIECSEGSSNLFKENFMVFKPDGQPYPNGVAFRVFDTTQRICASNKVYGTANITDGSIDLSC